MQTQSKVKLSVGETSHKCHFKFDDDQNGSRYIWPNQCYSGFLVEATRNNSRLKFKLIDLKMQCCIVRRCFKLYAFHGQLAYNMLYTSRKGPPYVHTKHSYSTLN